MLSKVWNWIRSFFGSDAIGVIWRAIFTAGKNAVAEMVSDPANQAKALEIAKSLLSGNLSDEQKRAKFNEQLKEWAKAAGKTLTDAAVNALRENAVVALKCV